MFIVLRSHRFAENFWLDRFLEAIIGSKYLRQISLHTNILKLNAASTSEATLSRATLHLVYTLSLFFWRCLQPPLAQISSPHSIFQFCIFILCFIIWMMLLVNQLSIVEITSGPILCFVVHRFLNNFLKKICSTVGIWFAIVTTYIANTKH